MKVGLFYASMSGNTLALVTKIGESLAAKGHETSLHDMLDTHPRELANYKLVVVGVSTYDEGLNAIAQLFLDTARVEGTSVAGVVAGVVSLGDSMYPDFATGGEAMAKGLEAMGVKVEGEQFVVDGEVSAEVETAAAKWAVRLVTQMEEG